MGAQQILGPESSMTIPPCNTLIVNEKNILDFFIQTTEHETTKGNAVPCYDSSLYQYYLLKGKSFAPVQTTLSGNIYPLVTTLERGSDLPAALNQKGVSLSSGNYLEALAAIRQGILENRIDEHLSSFFAFFYIEGQERRIYQIKAFRSESGTKKFLNISTGPAVDCTIEGQDYRAGDKVIVFKK